MPSKVLFVTYGGGHAKIVRALTDEILRRGKDLKPIVLALTNSAASFEGSGVDTIGFRTLVRPGDEEALAKGRELLSAIPSNSAVVKEESIAYLGLSFMDLASRIGVTEAERRYNESRRNAFLPLGPMGRAFDLVEPELVVATNSPRAEQAAIEVARQRGIPAICVMDLFGGFELPRVKRADYADILCVLSQGVKNVVAKLGRDPAQIAVTGNPAFDSYADPSIAADAYDWKEKMGWGSKRLVVWASQVEPSDPGLSMRVLDRLVERFGSNPKIKLIFRPHPSESLDLTLVPDTVYISTQTERLATVVKAADCVIVISSTVGLEACLLGTPLVALNIPITMEVAPYADDGMALEARTVDAIAEVVEASLNGERPISPELPEVGKAASLIVDQMETLLSRSKPNS